MSESGSPPPRSAVARPILLALLGAAILGGVTWRIWPPGHGTRAPVAPLTATAITRPDAADPASRPAHPPAPPGVADAIPAPDASPTRPSFDVVRVAPDGGAVIAGRAAPDAEVALLDDGRVIGTARADDSGQFVLLPDKRLPAGGQELSLRAGPPGGATVQGDTPAVLVVPAAPDRLVDKQSPAPVAVLTPPDAPPRLLSVPSDAPAGGPGQVALRVVDYDAHGAIRFAGTARPGSLVRLYIDNLPVGDAVADAAGHWGLAPAGAVGDGAHRLRADDLGPKGRVLSRVELPFRRAAFATDDPGFGRVVVQPRQTLWRIARHVYGHGVRYTEIFAANRDQIRDANRIYPGQVFALPGDAAGVALSSTGAASSSRAR